MSRFSILLLFVSFLSCNNSDVTIRSDEQQYRYVSPNAVPSFKDYQDVYVSVYSNLYFMDGSRKVFYTAILSLRNISSSDTIYFNKVNYFSSDGKLLKEYIKNSVLVLHPMESVDYIVEHYENEGGSGANFIVSYRKDTSLLNKPLIETVMTGTISNLGFAFKNEGVEVLK